MKTKMTVQRLVVLDFLRTYKPRTAAEVAELLGSNPRAASQVLQRMARDGLAKRIKHGGYVLAAQATDVPKTEAPAPAASTLADSIRAMEEENRRLRAVINRLESAGLRVADL